MGIMDAVLSDESESDWEAHALGYVREEEEKGTYTGKRRKRLSTKAVVSFRNHTEKAHTKLKVGMTGMFDPFWMALNLIVMTWKRAFKNEDQFLLPLTSKKEPDTKYRGFLSLSPKGLKKMTLCFGLLGLVCWVGIMFGAARHYPSVAKMMIMTPGGRGETCNKNSCIEDFDKKDFSSTTQTVPSKKGDMANMEREERTKKVRTGDKKGSQDSGRTKSRMTSVITSHDGDVVSTGSVGWEE